MIYASDRSPVLTVSIYLEMDKYMELDKCGF